MRSKEFENQTALHLRESEIYRLYKLKGIEKSVIMEKMGISRSTFMRSISNFERNEGVTCIKAIIATIIIFFLKEAKRNLLYICR